MNSTIADYYDRLAPDYDADRFANSYGRFLDAQERRILARLLPPDAGTVLDIGCGTGRLTTFATQGCDASAESIRVARERHPEKTFTVADATALPFADASFDAALCFHVLMHLERDVIAALLGEAARVLRPSGVFVVDVASGTRRRLVRRSSTGWHGGTSLTPGELAALARPAGLRMTAAAGIAMSPVHRVPPALRRAVDPVDRLLCRAAPGLASYFAARFVRADRL